MGRLSRAEKSRASGEDAKTYSLAKRLRTLEAYHCPPRRVWIWLALSSVAIAGSEVFPLAFMSPTVAARSIAYR